MRGSRVTTAVLGAALLAAPATLTAPTAAQAAPSAMTAPAAAAAWAKPVPKGDVTSRVDVDGDGRGDLTTFRTISRDQETARYRLTVRTSRGKTSSLSFALPDYLDQPASDFWVGATGIDGVRGNEIVLDLIGGVGDATDIRTYAWRNGKLVLVPAAGSSSRFPNWPLMWVDFGRATGFTFSMGKSGIRYVTKHDLKASRSGRTFTGTNTLYRWSGNGWRKLKTTKVSVNRKVASSYTDLNGLTWR
ncbi:hypothetical protein [Mobilicoccus caccae]|uniref:hypothetical protein n=1 Tax=Mobilicoccus caccae TaxID=1859295 RepID=UPI0024E06604|nr:hypothetical protein [Mobilicoccus caccae]